MPEDSMIDIPLSGRSVLLGLEKKGRVSIVRRMRHTYIYISTTSSCLHIAVRSREKKAKRDGQSKLHGKEYS